MVVVRETFGANRPEDVFIPTGKMTLQLPDGKQVEIELASWEYIGDTHIRFVFDGPTTMINANPQDLEKLGIKDVDQALTLALSNIKRVYGAPKSVPLAGGVMTVEGKSPDLNSSYFLDRGFWQDLLTAHSEGLVVAVPTRGSVLYTPLSNLQGVAALRRGIAGLHASSERQRVSSGLFLFKDGKWSVLQAPVKP